MRERINGIWNAWWFDHIWWMVKENFNPIFCKNSAQTKMKTYKHLTYLNTYTCALGSWAVGWSFET